MRTWKALLAAIGIFSGVTVLLVVIRAPKFDALMRNNPPSVYIPTLAVIVAFMTYVVWRDLRK